MNTAMGIYHASYFDCLIATSLAVNLTCKTNNYCCVYSLETPDDG